MANISPERTPGWWESLPKEERSAVLMRYDAVNALRLKLAANDPDLETLRLSKYVRSSNEAWASLAKSLNSLRSRPNSPAKRRILQQVEELVELSRTVEEQRRGW
jgi:hypothetical protein